MTKYSDLIHFEPIVTVKVLTDADAEDQVREDVRTFVVSDTMAKGIESVFVPDMRFDVPGDHKGIFVVATYGTGKTHLMSVLSGVAERADLVDELAHEGLRNALRPVAGNFKVIRSEIGGTRMALRDIVCGMLEAGLERMDIKFKFPSLDDVPATKPDLVRMMQEFEAKYPDQGLLFVLDELLDYLRTRRDLELTMDLAFLREVGEITRSTRFRFIAGVQESLFDNPRFSNVASEIVRVKERFDQLRISREDVSFVVQERLLRKTVDQRDLIRDHLQPFTPAFEGLSERMDDFIRLFPVHPAFLNTFEGIRSVEKRKVLTTLSTEMEQLLDRELPDDQPGLICSDSYRAQLDADPANHTIPEVREVLEKADTLRGLAARSIATKDYVEPALRIIDALAVHRLTTGDIYSPIGMTPEQLRDDLCLLPPNLPERDAYFIRVTIDSILQELVTAVSGQFISIHPDNSQVYLDVRKDIDYDKKIEERAASLDDAKLDEAYFKALEEVLEQRDAPYVASYRIWRYELPWAEKNVGRSGYLFMGAPNERSTAQPPRDFYVYYLQPYDRPRFTDERKPDEVFFDLQRPDDDFTLALRRYAGADALALESTETHRAVYEDKRRRSLADMVGWLKRNMGEAITVTHAGESQPLSAWPPPGGGPVKQRVDDIAATALKAHFEDRYPDYPVFEVNVTASNLGETARAAVAQIVTGRPTTAGTKVLAALELIDNETSLRDDGTYARDLLARLGRGNGMAVNRSELLVERDPGLPTWGPWHLEPEWLTVVATALCQMGKLDIGFPDGQIDALGLDQLLRKTAGDLAEISHVAPPKPTPVAVLKDVAELLGLPSHVVPDSGADESLVQQMATAAEGLREKLEAARNAVSSGALLWGALVIDRQAEREARLDALQKALDNIRARNSVGKLNRVNLTPEQLEAARVGRDELRWIEAASIAKNRLDGSVAYVSQAQDLFGPGDPNGEDARRLRDEVIAVFASEEPIKPADVTPIANHADQLRLKYRDEAARAHSRDRLDAAGDDAKRAVLEGDAYRDLKRLSVIQLLPAGAFGSLETRLANIGSCKTFDETKLSDTVVCPDCGYRPKSSDGPTARAQVDSIDDELVALVEGWTRTLADALSAPEIQDQIALLGNGERAAVESFSSTGALPAPVSQELLDGINKALNRFEVRTLSAHNVWKALFPTSQPATLDELSERFGEFIESVRDGKPAERIRVLPGSEDDQ